MDTTLERLLVAMAEDGREVVLKWQDDAEARERGGWLCRWCYGALCFEGLGDSPIKAVAACMRKAG